LIVRGICCLAPGIKGISDNIRAISIIDKYLEHARVFIFHNKGEELVYLSSADLMVRNLNHRVETMFPIFDKHLQYIIKNIMKIQLSDNVKARIHDHKNHNKYAKNDGMPVRSQYDIYYFIKRRLEKVD
jgi:polyphosphate kinase